MMQFFNFVMSALNDPLAAGTQMALEGVSPDMIGSAVAPPQSNQTLGTMIQGSNPTGGPLGNVDAAGNPINPNPNNPTGGPLGEGPQNAVYQPQQQGTAQVMQAGGGGTPDELRQRFQQAITRGDPERGVKGLSNPNAVAAVMATGQHESAFAPGNVYGTWSDPSESGEAGTSGGALSWRAGRLSKLLSYGGGDSLPEVEQQASFFLQEDPNLVAKLEAAKSPEEAQSLMNNAWQFAGYNKPGGEAGARMNTAKALASNASPPGVGQDKYPTGMLSPEGGGEILAEDDGRFTAADITSSDAGMPTAGAAPEQTRAQKLANKIAQIGKGIKVPERQPVEAPRITGGLAPQVGGAYNPAELGEMFALLGGQAGKNQLPPLSQLIRGS